MWNVRYNYVAQFFIAVDSNCIFEDLEGALRAYYEHEEEGKIRIEISNSGSDIDLYVEGWRINITVTREPLMNEELRELASQCDDETARRKILADHERWELVTEADEHDQYFNYFLLTCDVIKTYCPDVIEYSPALGEFIL